MADNLSRSLLRPGSSSGAHYLVIGIGAETFGIPASQIQEIIGLGDLDQRPRLPRNFAGPAQIVGKVLSLARLPAPFTRPAGEYEVTDRTCVLILKTHSAISSKIPIAVVVDRVDRMIELGPDDVETIIPRRKGFWSAYTVGFAKRHLPVVLIDLQQLILSQAEGQRANAQKRSETATSRIRRAA